MTTKASVVYPKDDLDLTVVKNKIDVEHRCGRCTFVCKKKADLVAHIENSHGIFPPYQNARGLQLSDRPRTASLAEKGERARLPSISRKVKDTLFTCS